jgi:hypothetical protein
MGQIEEASQEAYKADMAARQAAGETCDADLSPKERAERAAFDKDRSGTYTGNWPARQK